MELQESLRMVRDLEELKNTPLKVVRLMGQKRYLSAVNCLSSAVDKMFGEDLVAVAALGNVRERIMDLKEVLLEAVVAELKEAVLGPAPDLSDGNDSDEEEDGGGAGDDSRSDSAMSYLNDDARSVVSFRHPAGGASAAAGQGGAGAGAWAVDLTHAVDEQAEAALLDPSAAGPLFIRLLVKTIHVLRVEDDVERMILDSLYAGYLDNVLLRSKDLAAARLASLLDRRTGTPFCSDEEEVAFHGRLFAKYAGQLLDGLTALVQRLLYVLRLLALSKDMRSTSSATSSSPSMQSRKAVLELWNDLEDLVIRELRVHFLEEDIEKISDRPQLPAASSAKGSALDEEDERRRAEGRLVFRPSAGHSALVFKRAVAYALRCGRLLKDHALLPADDSHAHAHRGSTGMGMGMTVLDSMSANAAHPLGGVGTGNKVLGMLQLFLESELVPVIQSAANGSMRDLALNPEAFYTSSSTSSTSSGVLPLESWPLTSSSSACVWPVAESLFRYWLLLFHPPHRAMVSVVLDRLLRGYASSAREALGGLAFSYLSCASKEVLRCLRADPLYAAYRARVAGGRGRGAALEEAIAGACEHPLGGDLPAVDERGLQAAYLKEISGLWGPGTGYWELTAAAYPVTAALALKPSASLSALAALAYACDWLLHRTVSQCNSTTRQGAGAVLHGLTQNPSPHAHPAGSNSSSTSSRTLRQELYDSKHLLATTVLEALRDVVRTSDEVLACLRGELALLCLHYLAKLASTSSGEEEVLAQLMQQLGGYLSAVQTALSPFALPLVAGPLAALLPRALSRAIILQYGNSHSNTSSGAPSKSRMLRLVVSLQQQAALVLQACLGTSSEVAEARRTVLDVLTLGCEALRKLIAAIDLPAAELRAFLLKHFADYSKDEARFLWSRATDKGHGPGDSLDDLLRAMDALAKADRDKAANKLFTGSTTVTHA